MALLGLVKRGNADVEFSELVPVGAETVADPVEELPTPNVVVAVSVVKELETPGKVPLELDEPLEIEDATGGGPNE